MASSSPYYSSPLSSDSSPLPSPQHRLDCDPPLAPVTWSREENKLFETALASIDLGTSDCWQHLAASVPGKDAVALKQHFDILVADIELIEAGIIPLPNYLELEGAGQALQGVGEAFRGAKKSGYNTHVTATFGGAAGASTSGTTSKIPCSKSSEIERRKGIPWTEEEHKSFLLGLAKFGKGDWRSISRNFVRTRTPTQVASHAQKYFIRLNSIKKDRRRSSIHDITSVNGGDAAQTCQVPITGQAISAAGSSEVPMYGAAVGQPVSGTFCPPVGMPIIMPSNGFPAPFVSGAPLPPQPLVPGAPIGAVPVAYPLTQPGNQVAQAPFQQVGRL